MQHRTAGRFGLLRAASAWTLLLLAATLALAAPAAPSALVLYDTTGQYGWTGRLYAQHLRNLLSHFDVPTSAKPVSLYQPGDLAANTAVFYLGTVYDEPLPEAFCRELLTTRTTVCWMGYNIWQAAWRNKGGAYEPAFEKRYGIRFKGLAGDDWTEVVYRGISLPRTKNSGVGKVEVLDDRKVTVLATCRREPDDALPYLMQCDNLWYVADNPLADADESDRSLVFADALHDMLGIDHPTARRAGVRIEDVAPVADPKALRAIADYLSAEGVPFCVSVIPEYHDPAGVFTKGKPLLVRMNDRPEFVAALRYMTERGGQVLQHGTTHQLGAVPNADNGVTGADYEFCRILRTAPGPDGVQMCVPPGESAIDIRERVLRGAGALRQAGFTPIGWNMPHYLATELAYREIATLYPLAVDRGTYFASDGAGVVHWLPQTLPFVIRRDVHGFMRVPENLGYISPAGNADDLPILPADLLRRARANHVVRDGMFGFYFHPDVDLKYLKETVAGLKEQGFTFVAVSAELR